MESDRVSHTADNPTSSRHEGRGLKQTSEHHYRVFYS
jgi:hypothetical protein